MMILDHRNLQKANDILFVVLQNKKKKMDDRLFTALKIKK